MFYADIALNLPLPHLFTYEIPKTFSPRVGSRVVVPLGQKGTRCLVGVVVGVLLVDCVRVVVCCLVCVFWCL